MIITARQLEVLHAASGSNGHVLLPYQARLSPLASDWVRAKKVALGYGDPDAATPASRSNGAGNGSAVSRALVVSPSDVTHPAAPTLWWCDGPCGPAKAAVGAMSKEASLRALDLPADAKRIGAVIRAIAADVKAGKASAGVLLVQSAAVAVVLANRCPSLRAIVGTTLESVEHGIQQVAANVLIIEHPRLTMQQVKNLLSRFARAKHDPSEDLRRQLEELANCG